MPILSEDAKPLSFPLEMPDDCTPQLYADCMAQVQFLSSPLRLQPLRHDMPFHSRLGAVWPKLPAILHPEPVKPGGDDLAILLVEIANPCVELLNVSQEDRVVGWQGAVVAEPTELGWVQESRNYQLVCSFRMVGVLLINCVFKVHEALHHLVPGPAPHKVINPSRQEDPHGSGLAMVVLEPCKLKVTDCGTSHSQPVNVDRICLASQALTPWSVYVVQLAGAHHDVHPSLWPDTVAGTAGRAHVGQVGCLVLHALHDPDLTWGVVTMDKVPVMSAADVAV